MDIVEKLETSLTMSMFLNESDLYAEYAARCREAKDEILKLRAELEAAQTQNPVARMLEWIGPRYYRVPKKTARTYEEYGDDQVSPNREDSYWRNGAPLYLAAGALKIPDAFQMVPKRITPEMEAVYRNDRGAYQTAQELHDAMLEAAKHKE